MRKNTSNSSTVSLSNVRPRPLTKRITHKRGNSVEEERVKLNDGETVSVALKAIDDYTKTNGRLPAGIDGKFVQWLRDVNKEVKGGADIVAIKGATVSRMVDDYSMLKGVDD